MKEELHTAKNRLPNVQLASKYLPKDYSNLLTSPEGRPYQIPTSTHFSNRPFTALDKGSLAEIKPEIGALIF